MMMTLHTPLEPPRSHGLLELRAAIDFALMPAWLSALLFKKPKNLGLGKTVMVLPGFGAGDAAMYPMRKYLKHYGFNALGWGLGVNKAGLDKAHDPEQLALVNEAPKPYQGEAGVSYLAELMIRRAESIVDRIETPISLVGWSLGGTIAREVARELPDAIDQVITLGSPLVGGPKYTRAAKYLSQNGLDLDWIEAEVERRSAQPIQCPAVAIVSRSDGIVDWSASVRQQDPQTRYLVTDVPHLGMGVNRSILDRVRDELVSRVQDSSTGC